MSDTFKVGNVTRDPELRFTNAGKAVASFGIAENRKRGDEEQTFFWNVTAFGTLGENIAESISKGDRVIVLGDLTQSKYTTKEGEERTGYEIVAWNVGPDLLWATAKPVKGESSSNKSSSGRRAPQRPAQQDEEPF